jgi:diguanylate cyclase (GGDEF)-like protein
MPVVKRKTQPARKPKPRASILQSFPDGVILLDAAGRILEVNPPAAALTGMLEKQAVGKPIRDVFPAWSDWQERLRDPSSPAGFASPNLPDRTLEILRLPVASVRGKKPGSLIYIRDISDRIHMEEDHRRSMELLLDQNTRIQTLSTSLREQSIRDPITSLFNRCYMQEALNHELARASRSKLPISLLRIRLDQFIQTGETHGEKAGIEIIKIMGSLIYRYIRRGDLASRLAGDDFLLVMPGASPSIAVARAEQLRKAFHDSILNYLGAKIDCTLSCGVASYPAQGETPDALLQAADTVLQKSILAGGNKVTACE